MDKLIKERTSKGTSLSQTNIILNYQDAFKNKHSITQHINSVPNLNLCLCVTVSQPAFPSRLYASGARVCPGGWGPPVHGQGSATAPGLRRNPATT